MTYDNRVKRLVVAELAAAECDLEGAPIHDAIVERVWHRLTREERRRATRKDVRECVRQTVYGA